MKGGIVISKKSIGQFFTNSSLATFMAELANPKKGMKIIDPACGSGELLYHLLKLEKDLNLYGCEIDITVQERCKKRLKDANIFLHNGLYSKTMSYVEADLSNEIPDNSFDIVIANPPFNGLTNKMARAEVLSLFELGMLNGKPRKSQNVEVLFLERFVRLLKPNGKLITILPEGILSNEKMSYIRDWLFEHLSIELIISLPSKNVFHNVNVSSVLLCATKKECSPRQKTLFFTDIETEDFSLILGYLKNNKIFI